MLAGRGDFNRLYSSGGTLEVSGWILDPDVPAASIRISVDDTVRGEQAPEDREDVRDAFSGVAHARRSGFHFFLPHPNARSRITITALDGPNELIRIQSTFAPEFEDLPVPGPALLSHILPGPDPLLFQASGLFSYTCVMSALSNRIDFSACPRMLDWGCGSGRLSRLFLKSRPGPEVFGCDIDGEAVAWCHDNLPDGRFSLTGPLPPLPFPDGFFPLVIAYSVFTHLRRETQLAWLDEMRRIIAPGGILLASVHGPLAASCAFSHRGRSRLARLFGRRRLSAVLSAVLKEGFFDAGEDRALDGVAPAGYYRGVFQTPEWTRREWSRYFRVVEIRGGGMNSYQDLVILERP
ncbi:MAG: methyltransferase domain-containing protein [Thermoanaerobaculia bacterium]